MNLLHISDIHFRREYEDCKEGYKGMLSTMQSPLIALEKCLSCIQQQGKLDLVVISGDLTEDGAVEDYRFLKEWLETALGETKIVVTLGNHDIKSHFRVGWCGQEASELPYNQVEIYPEVAILSFDNSSHGHADGIVDEKQFQWLQKTLEQLQERPIILVTHHHLLTQQSSTPQWPGTKRFLKILEPYRIHCILNGHTHHPFISEVNGIPYFTAASMSFVGEDEGDGIVRFEERYGYNFYQFENGRMTRQISENFISGHVLKTVDMRQ